MSGKPIAFLGAFHFCPGKNGKIPHVGGPTLATSPNVFVGGLPVAVKGDKLVCVGPPDTITGGSSSVTANGKAIARLGDGTAHNGKIAVGNPTVLAGDGGGFSMVSPTAEYGSWNPVMNNAPPKHEMCCGNMTYHTNEKGEISKVEGRVDELDWEPTPHPYREPGRLYGGMTLPCGGRDSTQSQVFKDPATAHLDEEAWRKPVVSQDGTVMPYPNSRQNESPIKIRKFKERSMTAERTYEGKHFKAKRDENGFPEFTVFETYLDESHIGTTDEDAHFRAANARLAELIREEPGRARAMGLTDEAVDYILQDPPPKEPPFGFTWHHHQDLGKIQLTDRALHQRFGHTGGMSIWGGGRD